MEKKQRKRNNEIFSRIILYSQRMIIIKPDTETSSSVWTSVVEASSVDVYNDIVVVVVEEIIVSTTHLLQKIPRKIALVFTKQNTIGYVAGHKHVLYLNL